MNGQSGAKAAGGWANSNKARSRGESLASFQNLCKAKCQILAKEGRVDKVRIELCTDLIRWTARMSKRNSSLGKSQRQKANARDVGGARESMRKTGESRNHKRRKIGTERPPKTGRSRTKR